MEEPCSGQRGTPDNDNICAASELTPGQLYQRATALAKYVRAEEDKKVSENLKASRGVCANPRSPCNAGTHNVSVSTQTTVSETSAFATCSATTLIVSARSRPSTTRTWCSGSGSLFLPRSRRKVVPVLLCYLVSYSGCILQMKALISTRALMSASRLSRERVAGSRRREQSSLSAPDVHVGLQAKTSRRCHRASLTETSTVWTRRPHRGPSDEREVVDN